jgi:hypothetical protein
MRWFRRILNQQTTVSSPSSRRIGARRPGVEELEQRQVPTGGMKLFVLSVPSSPNPPVFVATAGQSFSLSATASDTDSAATSLTGTIDWGDGSSSQSLPSQSLKGGFNVIFQSHTYSNPSPVGSPYEVSIVVVDNDGNSDSQIGPVVVNPRVAASGMSATTALVRNADGRLDAFVVGSDRAVWHRTETIPGGAWGAWSSLGGVVSSIGVARNADGRLEVFAVGGDSGVWHQWQTYPGGSWSGWSSLGGVVSSIAVASNANDDLDLFAIGSDSGVWHQEQTASSFGSGGLWSGWSSLGGVVKSIAVTRNADGRLEVFAVGGDSSVWHQAQTSAGSSLGSGSSWSGWSDLGGVVSSISVAANADGRLEVFAIGSDRAVWHQVQTFAGSGLWSGWSSLGGVVQAIAAARNLNGQLEVIAIGGDRAVWHVAQTTSGGAWSLWSRLDGVVSSITATSPNDGPLEAFAVGSDRALWQDGEMSPVFGWSGWFSLGGQLIR